MMWNLQRAGTTFSPSNLEEGRRERRKRGGDLGRLRGATHWTDSTCTAARLPGRDLAGEETKKN